MRSLFLANEIRHHFAAGGNTSLEDQFAAKSSFNTDTHLAKKKEQKGVLKKMAQRRSLKRRKYSREEEEDVEVREERMVMMPTAMPSSAFVPIMPSCFSAPSTATMGATASYILIMETQNRIKLKTD